MNIQLVMIRCQWRPVRHSQESLPLLVSLVITMGNVLAYFVGANLAYTITFILIVYVLPLLLPTKGIIQNKPYTHAWASFIVLLY